MFRFIKAIIPLLTMVLNLPCLMVSCTNFLRSTCQYTECLLSFQTGSCPTEGTTASYSSCLYFDFTDLFILQGTGFRGRSPCFVVIGRLLMQYLTYLIVIGFLSRTLPDLRNIWNPARFWNKYAASVFYAAIASCFAGRLMSFSILCGS